MAKVVAKLFKRPEDVNQVIKDLKAKGLDASVIENSSEIDKQLADTGLPEQALEYYKTGVMIGGKIVKVSVDDAKAGEVNELLIAAGFNSLVDRPAQWFTSPGFVKAKRMSGTDPIDAQMSGDFRKY